MTSPNPPFSLEEIISGSVFPFLMPSIETDMEEHNHEAKPAHLLTPQKSASKPNVLGRGLAFGRFEKIFIDLTEIESSPEPSRAHSRASPTQNPNGGEVEHGRAVEDPVNTGEASATGILGFPGHSVKDGSLPAAMGPGRSDYWGDEDDSETYTTPNQYLDEDNGEEDGEGNWKGLDSKPNNTITQSPPFYVRGHIQPIIETSASPVYETYPSINSQSIQPSPKASIPKPSVLSRSRLSCKERKRLVVSPATRPAKLAEDLKAWIRTSNELLDPFREEEDCWLHPSPPPSRLTKNGHLLARQNISKRFTFTCPSPHAPYQLQTYSLTIPYGIAYYLVYHSLTLQQQDGWINQNWQNSHLCGNWTCLNPKHLTVESQGINLSRNNCFGHRKGCFHNPSCFKDFKVPLGSDGLVVPVEDGGGQVGSSGETNGWAEMDYGEDGGIVEDGDVGLNEVDLGFEGKATDTGGEDGFYSIKISVNQL